MVMSLVDKLFGQRSWFLRNEDTGEELIGQYEAEDVQQSWGSNYAEQTSLNRASPIRQFISGQSQTISFNATLFAHDEFLTNISIDGIGTNSVESDLELLKKWSQRDEDLGRPPICSFWIGNGSIGLAKCTIDPMTASFSKLTISGKLKGITIPIKLTQYTPFSLEYTPPPETRYHRSKENDYYEMLTYNEYGSAEIGDVIRKRHPEKLNIETADVIKLPSIAAIRSEIVEQKSNTFKTAYGNKETPQRTLRLQTLGRHNVTYVSHIL